MSVPRVAPLALLAAARFLITVSRAPNRRSSSTELVSRSARRVAGRIPPINSVFHVRLAASPVR